MFSHACRVIATHFYWHNLDEIAQLAHVYWNLLCCSRVLDLHRTGGRQKPDTKTVLFFVPGCELISCGEVPECHCECILWCFSVCTQMQIVQCATVQQY